MYDRILNMPLFTVYSFHLYFLKSGIIRACWMFDLLQNILVYPIFLKINLLNGSAGFSIMYAVLFPETKLQIFHM